MKQVVKIWVLVVAMVMGGALPPQVIGDGDITMQWCAQAKNKHKKNKKSKKKDKVKKAMCLWSGIQYRAMMPSTRWTSVN